MVRFWSSRGGAASIIMAISLLALIGSAALAVDFGSVYLSARRLQGVADAAAMAAAQDLPLAQQRAEEVAAAATHGPNTAVSTTLGVYQADGSIAPNLRFSEGGGASNAVRVTLRSTTPLFFASLFMPTREMQIQRTAVAAQAQLASFQIGSRLLAVQGGVPNALLTGLTGSSVSLSVMDYESLAHADVDLFSYLQALRTRLNLHAATFDQVLQTEVSAPTALAALSDALGQEGNSAAAEPISQIASAANGLNTQIQLNSLFQVEPYGAQDHVSDGQQRQISVNAMDIADAVLELANGNRQVALNLGATIPGLSNVTAWLAIGQRPNNSPWLTVSKDDSVIIRTAQMRLYVVAQVGVAGVAGIASVRLPVVVEAASAQAKLESMRCSSNAADGSVTLSAAPSLGTIAIGDINLPTLSNFETPLTISPAAIVKTALIKVTGAARTDLGGLAWQDVEFGSDDIRDGTVKTVQTTDLAQASVGTLVSNLQLSVSALGLGVNVNGVGAALRPTLVAAAAPLDQVVNDLSNTLGLHLGEADLRVNGLRCNGVALVG